MVVQWSANFVEYVLQLGGLGKYPVSRMALRRGKYPVSRMALRRDGAASTAWTERDHLRDPTDCRWGRLADR
jgi:hypothetical protein